MRDRDLFGLVNYWTLYTKVQQPTLIELSSLALRSIIIAQTRTTYEAFTRIQTAIIVRSGDSGLNCTYCKVLRNTRIIVDATANLQFSRAKCEVSLGIYRRYVIPFFT